MKVLKKITALAMAAVTAGTLGLNAFAGGPMPQEDELAAGSVVSAATERPQLPSGLSVGSVYNLRPMGSSGVHISAITVDNDEQKIFLTDRSSLKVEQAFQLIASTNGYKLKALCSPSGKMLDVLRINENIQNGCSIDLWKNNDDAAQEFVMTDGTSSSCVIRLASNKNLVLAKDGDLVILQTYNAANNQRWRFVERTNTYTKDPDPDAQNKTNWCWAAATKMVAKHNGKVLNDAINTSPQTLTSNDGLHKPYYGYSISGTESRYLADGVQHAIVKRFHGNDKDEKGTADDTRDALQFVSKNTMNVGWWFNHANRLTDDMIAHLNEDLENGKYVVGTVTTSGNQNGHSIVIKSHNDDGTYAVFDPLNKTENNIPAKSLLEEYGYKYGENRGMVNAVYYCH